MVVVDGVQVPLLRPAREPAVKQALPDTDRLGYYSHATFPVKPLLCQTAALKV